MVEERRTLASARRLSLFVFCSGACALLYQVVWQREFRLIFGASTAASGAVLAAFIGGLGAGSLLLARQVERSTRPFALYARFEAAIALSTALTPALLTGVRLAYVALGGTQALGQFGGTLLRLLLSALVIFVPTFFMGGTLPAVARAVTGELDAGRRNVALLYGVNTLGAVVGSGVATFFLLEILGNRSTLWVGCLLNLLIAVLAQALSRSLPEVPVEPTLSPVDTGAEAQLPRQLVLGAAFLVGAVFFLMELVWFRMLGPLLGGSVFTFGLVLCVALAGIGLGGAWAARLGRAGPATISAFALTCLLEAAAIALPFAAGDGAAFFTLALYPLSAQGFAGSVLTWTLVCLWIVFPASFVAGVQFPLLISLAGKGRAGVARQLGQVYAANTVGSVAGSLAGGFGLLPWLSAPGAWRLAAGLLLALGLGATTLARFRTPGARLLLPGTIAILTGWCLLSQGPTPVWRDSAIGANRMRPDVLLPGAHDSWVRTVRRQTIWETDGVEAAVALRGGDGLAFIVNGKVDGHALGDAATQVMGGLLGAILHPAPKKALVIGLGTGCTAGWLARVPGIERVDVMELEPAILEVARRMSAVNEEVLDNPKVHLLIGDARELLATSHERYDVVFSEPSNPYRSGIANLYTREYYQAAQRHLAPGGLFIQWLQSYEVDGEVIQTAYATLSSVFGSVDSWNGRFGDLLLIGTEAESVLDVEALRRTIAAEPFATAMRVAWSVDTPEGVLAHHLAGPAFARWLVQQTQPPLNTDDDNRIEFAFARSVGLGPNQSSELANLADDFDRREPQAAMAVDPSLLRLERWLLQVRANLPLAPPPGLSPLEARAASALAAFGRGDLEAAASEWPKDGPARTSYERLVRLAAGYRSSSAERLAEADALRRLYPIDVEVIGAFEAAARSEIELTLGHLEKAFVAHRSIPWTQSGLLREAVALASAPGKSPEWDHRLATALSQPFAVLAHDPVRLEAYHLLLVRSGDLEACATAYEQLGENVGWTHDELVFRLTCFEGRRPKRVEGARRDLARFLAQQPRLVSSGLSAWPSTQRDAGAGGSGGHVIRTP